MHPVAVLFSIFALIMMVFGGLVYSGNTELIRSLKYTKVKNVREYAKFLGKSIVLVAVVILAGSLISAIVKAVISLVLTVIVIVIVFVIISGASKKYY
ncbi:MAG: hypothetical protein Q4C42_09560 [Clostridia bacterium]|nr:hypothetical protein [Clostridia bacterium]